MLTASCSSFQGQLHMFLTQFFAPWLHFVWLVCCFVCWVFCLVYFCSFVCLSKMPVPYLNLPYVKLLSYLVYLFIVLLVAFKNRFCPALKAVFLYQQVIDTDELFTAFWHHRVPPVLSSHLCTLSTLRAVSPLLRALLHSHSFIPLHSIIMLGS